MQHSILSEETVAFSTLLVRLSVSKFNKRFASWLVITRKVLGISQAELASIMNVSRHTISNYETNNSKDVIRLEMLKKFLSALNCGLTVQTFCKLFENI